MERIGQSADEWFASVQGIEPRADADRSGEGPQELGDAIRLLERIVGPCETEATDHGWRKCKRCQAIHGVEERFALSIRLLETALSHLRRIHG